MIDSLGGILTNGLLGNGPNSMILGQFNLSLFGITIIIEPVGGGGGAVVQHWPSVRTGDESEEDKFLTIKIRLKQQEITRVYRISNGNATVLIKINESVKTFITKTSILVNNFVVKPIKRVFKINVKDPSNK